MYIYLFACIYVYVYKKYLSKYICSLCSVYICICICICICKCFYTLNKLFRSSKNQSTGSPPVTQLHSHTLPVLQDVFNPSPQPHPAGRLTPSPRSPPPLAPLQSPEPAQREVSQCGALASGEGEL